MSPDPHEVQTETIRYLLAVNAEKEEEIARLTSELAAAQAERDSLNAGKARLAEILGFEADSEEANRWKWLNLEVSSLKDELTATRRGPVVEWEGVDGDYTMSIGGFSGSISEDGWALELRTYLGSRGVDGGPETGDAGKAACFAAYLKAAGLA